ncbi:MAG: methyltransferase domain-containing protein [Saprospiraceae bacterium]
MKKFLQAIIADPHSGEALQYYTTAKELTNEKTGTRYKVENGVPVLLPAEPAQVAEHSRLHSEQGSAFDYADHYQKDAEHFDYFKAHEDGASRHENRRLHETIIRAIPEDASLVLDAGCGSGWVAAHFCPKGVKVISMDISTVNPREALRRVHHELHAGLVGDVYHIPLKKNSVDCIIASEIMEHVASPRLFVEKLLETVRPGGTVIITTPYDEQIEYYLCVHCNQPTPKNGHLHFFNLENIGQYLPEKGGAWRAGAFSNKYLSKLRSHILFEGLPYFAWRFIDRLACQVLGAETRFLIEITKE